MNLGRDHRKAIDLALERNPDPITAYESIVNSFLEGKHELISRDVGIVLLEEATRQFLESVFYKQDYRYLRLWMLYTSLVDNTRVIFDLLCKKEIASQHATYYQEYATMLELANLYVHDLLPFRRSPIILPALLKPKKYTNSVFLRRRIPLLS
jgi:hypothetical protein